MVFESSFLDLIDNDFSIFRDYCVGKFVIRKNMVNIDYYQIRIRDKIDIHFISAECNWCFFRIPDDPFKFITGMIFLTSGKIFCTQFILYGDYNYTVLL